LDEKSEGEEKEKEKVEEEQKLEDNDVSFSRMKIVVHLMLAFLHNWFLLIDFLSFSRCCTNIPYATVSTIIIYPETSLQIQEKDARSARRARVNKEPVLGNVIHVRSQNGTQERRFQTGAHFQVRSHSN